MKPLKYSYAIVLTCAALCTLAQPVSERASTKAGGSKVSPTIPKFVDLELPESMPEGNASWEELRLSVGQNRGSGNTSSKLGKKSAADRAQQFYLEYPDHPKAHRARKIEIDSLLSIDDGTDAAVHPRLRTKVAEYRRDSSIPVNQRAQVARMFDMREVTRNGQVGLDHRKAFEQVSRDIAAEFSDSEVGEQMLLSLAQQRGNKDSLKIARELAAGAQTARAKQSAEEFKTRLELLGQPLAKVLPGAIEKRSATDGLLTVLYSWSTQVPGSMATAKLLGSRKVENANWVGVNLDTEAGVETARLIAERDKFPGTQIYTSDSNRKTVPRKLGMGEAGLVYLVDSEGLIFDVQVHQDLMNMINSFGL